MASSNIPSSGSVPRSEHSVPGPDHMLMSRARLPEAGGHPAVGTTYAQGLATSNRLGPETVCVALDRTDSMRSPEQ